MEYEVDSYQLIPLVEKRPVIWDKNLGDYKQKSLTFPAWREVAVLLKEDFDKLSRNEQEKFTAFIIKKWRNIKDCWVKSNRKSRMGSKFVKKYVYDDQLKFLRSLTFDNLTDTLQNCLDCPSIDNDRIQIPELKEEPSTSSVAKVYSSRPTSKRRKIADVDKSFTLTVKEKEDRHLCFIKGVLPSLVKFNETQVLKFQMGVLELIQNIQGNIPETKMLDPLSFDYSKDVKSNSVSKIKSRTSSTSCSSFSDDSVLLF